MRTWVMLVVASVEAFWPPLCTLMPKLENVSSKKATVYNSPWLSAFFSAHDTHSAYDDYSNFLFEARRLERDFLRLKKAKQNASERAEDVVRSLFVALQHKTPEQGLRTMIARSSPFNCMRSHPFPAVLESMRKGKYQFLLGRFASFGVRANKKQDDETTCYVEVVVVGKVAVMDQCQVPRGARTLITTDTAKVAFQVELHNPTGGRWLFDTLRYVYPLAEPA